MKKSFTIQIFCPDGAPENMRVVDKKNWTGKVFYISRDFWADISDQYQEELEVPGVYVLSGKGESIEGNDDDLQTIYIGQAENLFIRIEQHILDPKKYFCNSIICVIGSGDFNSAHFRWMEADLIERAQEIERCDLQNRNRPNKPKIPKPEEGDAKHFLDEVLQMFPIVEVNAFTEPKTVKPPPPESVPIPNGKNKRLSKKEASEIRSRILESFQKKENVKLLSVTGAKFYNKSKTIRVCCTPSKDYSEGKEKSRRYWFTCLVKWVDFLEKGEEGFLILGMEGQSKALRFSIEEMNKIKENLPLKLTGGEITGWDMRIVEENGRFYLKLREKGKSRDITNHLFPMG